MTGNKCFLMTKRSVIREKTAVTDIGLKSAILVTGLTLGAGVMTACFQVLGTHPGGARRKIGA